ncbi:MAG: hypothetical protein ABJC19_11305 [Gemmatimonadota bacterium]
MMIGSVFGVSQPGKWQALLSGADQFIARTTKDGTPSRFVMAPLRAERCTIELVGLIVGVPECATPTWAIDHRGTKVVSVWPDVGKPDEGGVRVVAISTEGDTLFSGRYVIPLQRISPSQGDSIRDKVAGRSSNPQRAAAWRKVVLPAVFNPLKRVFIGDDGTFWIEYRARDGAHEWLIVSPSGKRSRRLRFPAATRVLEASGNTIWAGESDADGLESVVRYRMTPGR